MEFRIVYELEKRFPVKNKFKLTKKDLEIFKNEFLEKINKGITLDMIEGRD